MTAPSARAAGARNGDHVQSLVRGLAVIKAFDSEHVAMTLSEVARRTDMPRAAARRFLLTLVDMGYVGFDGQRFRLRPRILELGVSYFHSCSFIEIAQPYMEDVLKQVNESCSMSVLDGDDVAYVARFPTSRIMSVAIAVGTRFPAWATSMGRVLLSGLSDAALDAALARVEPRPLTPNTVTDREKLREIILAARSRGYCAVEEELELGLLSVAVPVHNGAGEVIAAVNVAVPTSRHTPESLHQEILPVLQRAAADIDQALKRLP